MPYIETIIAEKARIINNTPSIYGTFAEIGAGQEVVNHFFKVGRASQTVAKSMSAYDMTFSDHIYGKTDRYVSENRLCTMLEHEYKLLQTRLKKQRGHNTNFFAFADTVAVSTIHKLNISSHHGWMGIRFQNKYQSDYNEIILHVNLLDKTRLQQYETLGVLGVNLIYSAFYVKKNYKSIIKSLLDNLEANRVDIDVLRCSGNIFKQLKNQKLNIELIHQQSTQALLFHNTQKNILPADAMYEKHILIQQHCTRETHLYLQNKKTVLLHIQKTLKIKTNIVSLINIPIKYLKIKTLSDFFKKYIDSYLKNKNQYILISDFKKLYELKTFIRKSSSQYIFIILNTTILKQIFDTNSSQNSQDILIFFSQLCDSKTILFIPKNYQKKIPADFSLLEKYLIQNKQIIYF